MIRHTLNYDDSMSNLLSISCLNQKLQKKIDSDSSIFMAVSRVSGDFCYTTKQPVLEHKESASNELKFINGYPHVSFSESDIYQEIQDFLNVKWPTLDSVFIRFGDLHNDHTYPKVAQSRGFFVADVLRNIYKYLKFNVRLVAGLGNIGNRMWSVIAAQSSYSNEDVKKIISQYLEGKECLDENILTSFKKITEESLRSYKATMSTLGMADVDIILDSDVLRTKTLFLYEHRELNTKNYLDKFGYPKYLLQEILWISLFKKMGGINTNIISLICNNQDDHVLKTLSLLDFYDIMNVTYLLYGVGINGEQRDIPAWVSYINTNIIEKISHVFLQSLSMVEIIRMINVFTNHDKLLDWTNKTMINNAIKKYSSVCYAYYRAKHSQKLYISNSRSHIAGKELLYYLGLCLNKTLESAKAKNINILVDYCVNLSTLYNRFYDYGTSESNAIRGKFIQVVEIIFNKFFKLPLLELKRLNF